MSSFRLLIQPLPERGLVLRVCENGGRAWIYEMPVAHGEDVVVAVDSLLRSCSSIFDISVVCGVGSFSASRSALVAAAVLGATRGVPVRYVQGPIETPDDFARAPAHRVRAERYERPPHITPHS